MIGLILGMLVIYGLCWLGFHVTGALFSMFFWVFLKLPIAVALAGIGIGCCMTVILFPIGRGCFKMAGEMLT